MVSKESLLKILELPSDANQVQIKQAYRRLSKLYHPDINPSEQAAERFMQIYNSYQKLLQNDYISADNFANDLKYRFYTHPTPLTEEQIIKKYQYTYEPPTNPQEHKEWLIAVRARMKQYKQQAEQRQRESYEKFDKNPWYFYIKVGVIVVYMFGTVAWMGIAILPLMRLTENIETGVVVGLIAWPSAWLIRKSCIRMKNNLEPYFDKSKRI